MEYTIEGGEYLGRYASLGLLLLVGIGFVSVGLMANQLLRPDKPSVGKSTPYECGVDPVGEGWSQSQIRYYVYAYLYVLFAVEAVFIFPWVTVFDRPGFAATTATEMAVFVGLLTLGLLYAWRKRALTWV